MDGATRIELTEMVERMGAAAEAMEAAVIRLEGREVSVRAEADETVARIVATVESAREAELERKLADAEATIAELRAAATTSLHAGARKTAVAGTMLAKDAGESMDLNALDAALTSLSVEQRFAVKAEMLRAGLVR